MFDNVGGKIKVIAILMFWFGIIGSIIYGIVDAQETIKEIDVWGRTEEKTKFDAVTFLVISFVGSFASIVSAYFIYGFGEIVESATITGYKTKSTYRNNSSLSTRPNTNQLNNKDTDSPNQQDIVKKTSSPRLVWNSEKGIYERVDNDKII